jgi:hypothetical protein
MLLTVGGIAIAAWLVTSAIVAVTGVVVIALLLVAWRVTGSARLGWLHLFGIVVGVLELWADWLHVEHLGSLVYDDVAGLRVLASPWYMPVGWWLTSVQFGYLALWLARRWTPRMAIALIVLLGMTLPPWYEELAAPARAWHYTTDGPQLSNTPIWIILTYGGVMFAIASSALTFYAPLSWSRALLAGVFAGAGIMLSGVFWYSLLA